MKTHDPQLAKWYEETYLKPQQTTTDEREERVARLVMNQYRDGLRAEWMATNDLKPSRIPWCLGDLLVGRGHRCGYDCKYAKRDDFPVDDWRWVDHIEVFWHPKSQRYVLTSQPYNTTPEILSILTTYLKERGIAVRCQVKAGWHYPGWCPLLSFRKA